MPDSLPVARFCGWVSRRDTGEPDCEDAALVVRQEGRMRAAVSDGAGDSYFSGPWARTLCSAYCWAWQEPGDAVPNLSEARQSWQAEASIAGENSPLPWFALDVQRERGAFAAFVGLAVHEDSRTWEAVAVGDCCLFQVRGEVVTVTFPLSQSTDFNSVPTLLSSLADRGVTARTTRGTWQPGDDFFLVSDALAAWFLSETEAGRAPWKWLSTVGTVEEFARRIAVLRESGRLRNDDAALVHLRAEVG